MYEYDRTATAKDSLRSAMVAWAFRLCATMQERFTKYGGWRDAQTRSQLRPSRGGAELFMEGRARHSLNREVEREWTAMVKVYVHKQTPQVDVTFDWGDWFDPDDVVKSLQHKGDNVEMDIDPTASMQETVMKVSLWLSQRLNAWTDSKL